MTAPSVQNLMEKGYLPDNLPPIFNSKDVFQTFAAKPQNYLATSKIKGVPSTYSASKRGGQRRVFSLSHPLFQFDAAVFFVKHWPAITTAYQRSSGSLSVPRFEPNSIRAAKLTPHSELPKRRMMELGRFRFCLVTDVSRCFPSIYTHSIPWALLGKVASKVDRNVNSAAVFGNRLDFILRQSQDAQTIGIGVGSDISRMTAEIILSAVDFSFSAKYGPRSKPKFIRHVDDYWIGADSYEEAERHLSNIRSALGEYQLDLNELKTKVLPVFSVLGESWPETVEEVLKKAFGAYAHRLHRVDPVSAITHVFDMAREHGDDGIVRHAIRVIDDNRWWSRNWEVLEGFLSQCAVQYSHSFDYVARVVAWRARRGFPLNLSMWSGLVQSLLAQFSALGRDSETLWALWLLKELDLKINKGVSESIISKSSPLVLGYFAHLAHQGFSRASGIDALLWEKTGDDPFSGRSWPLTLELVHLQIAKAGGNPTGLGNALDEIFVQQRSLIDFNARPKVFVSDDGAPFEEPETAIEDFTSDYDDDDEEDFADLDAGIPF